MWLIYLFLLHHINKYSLIFQFVFSKWCTVNRRLYAAIIKEKRLFVNMWPRLFVLLPTLRCLQYYTVNTEQYLSSVRWWIRTQDLWLRSLICVTSKPPHLIILISHGATANHNFYWLALGAGFPSLPRDLTAYTLHTIHSGHCLSYEFATVRRRMRTRDHCLSCLERFKWATTAPH